MGMTHTSFGQVSITASLLRNTKIKSNGTEVIRFDYPYRTS